MWLSRMLSRQSEAERAEKGHVTMSGTGNFEAGASLNARNISLYSPYGYCAEAPVGEEIILIPSSDGQVALGTRTKAQGLEGGEIKISSKGGASIILKNDGSVIINNRFIIDKEGEIRNELSAY